MESIVHQIKDRESKLYTTKAEVHTSAMKEHTSIPKIDPNSRKIAEEMTKREIQNLGIKTKTQPSKQTLSYPKLQKAKRNPQKSLSKPIELKSETQAEQKPVQVTRGPSPSQECKLEINEIKDEASIQIQSNFKPLIMKPEDLVTVQELINVKQLKRKKTLESMDHLNLMKAFREELHKDYPELGLDLSCEGSSLRSDELDDVESHSHEAFKEKLDKQGQEFRDLNFKGICGEGEGEGEVQGQAKGIDKFVSCDGRSGGIENGFREGNFHGDEVDEKEMALEQVDGKYITIDIKNKTDQHEGEKVNISLEKLETQNSDIPIKESHTKHSVIIENLEISNENQETLKRKAKPMEIKESLSAISSKTKFESSPGHSKLVSLITEQPTIRNSSISFAKASFLHSPQESVDISVPRCHLNLSELKSTPIYKNKRLSQDSKVKTLNGIGSVDSLRHLLLKDDINPKSSTPKDLYSRTLEWSCQKQEKLKKMRKSMDLQSQQLCPFSPFPAKKRSETQLFHAKSSIFPCKPSLDSQASILKLSQLPASPLCPAGPTVAQSSYNYLSPVNSQIRYFSGCNMEKMIKVSKPMLSYKQINLLT